MSFKRSRDAFEADAFNPPEHAPFAFYGTPLPPYQADTRDDGSYVPIWKQEVVDERGRKRLHGAFTGGWSAGYYNTVGSKEGWTPSTFVSSRANRAKPQDDAKKRPEDFMDDEDLADQAEAQKLETQGTFAGLGNGAGGNSTKGMFADFFRATGDTIGIKLLQRMGWRQGQGIGPKIKRRAKGDEKGELHKFAPDDSPMISFLRKTDRKGLGSATVGRADSSFRLHEDDEDSGEDARILQRTRPKVTLKSKPRKKPAFGVGVLNDDGSDDEDPFSVGPRISYKRSIGADKKKKAGLNSGNADASVVKPMSASKKLVPRHSTVSGFRKCHDGRLPLDGFVLSSMLAALPDIKYPPPQVPPGWKPSKQESGAARASSLHTSTADAAKTSKLDAKARAELLGEQRLPGKSIFDFISPADRDRIATASGRSGLPPGRGEGTANSLIQGRTEREGGLWNQVPELDKQTAVIALQRVSTGWVLYAEDEEKQARFKDFLGLSAALHFNLPQKSSTTSREDWVRELNEFANAARLFKPTSGLLGSRFTTASNAPKLASDDSDSSPSTATKGEDPAEAAAKAGIYGQLTRSTQPFHPTRLLCKRFNVRPPPDVSLDPRDKPEAASEKANENSRLDLVRQNDMDRMMLEANVQRSASRSDEMDEVTAEASSSAMQPVVEVNPDINEALEGKKAGADVFKAIFGDSDDD